VISARPYVPVPADALEMSLGRAVQVDPIKPKLKPPGTKLLKLKIDILLLTSAFKFNLRRYASGGSWSWPSRRPTSAHRLAPLV